MSLESVGRKLVELCNDLKNFDAMRTLYAPDVVSVEGDGAQTRGQQAVIRKSEVWQAANAVHGEKVLGPFFNGPDQFAVHFKLEITRKASGERETLEEIGVYTVDAHDRITREQFFYDGVH